MDVHHSPTHRFLFLRLFYIEQVNYNPIRVIVNALIGSGLVEKWMVDWDSEVLGCDCYLRF